MLKLLEILGILRVIKVISTGELDSLILEEECAEFIEPRVSGLSGLLGSLWLPSTLLELSGLLTIPSLHKGYKMGSDY